MDFTSEGYNNFLTLPSTGPTLPSLDAMQTGGSYYNPVLDITNPEGIQGGDLITRITTAPGLVEGGIQTALDGRRVIMNNDGIVAYNDLEESFFTMNTTNRGSALSLIRSTTYTGANELASFVDQSSTYPTLVVTNLGIKTSATAPTVFITNETIGSVKYQLRISHSGSGDVENSLYIAANGGSETLSGPMAYILQNSASDQPALLASTDSGVNEFTAKFVNYDSGTGAVQSTQNEATSTNFYRIQEFKGSTAVTVALWVANNTTPNGTLSGNAGDICLSTDGNIYRCTGTTNWTAM